MSARWADDAETAALEAQEAAYEEALRTCPYRWGVGICRAGCWQEPACGPVEPDERPPAEFRRELRLQRRAARAGEGARARRRRVRAETEAAAEEAWLEYEQTEEGQQRCYVLRVTPDLSGFEQVRHVPQVP